MDDARPAFRPAFQAPDPDACRDMLDVRAGVDEIDRMLVALITRRQGYMTPPPASRPTAMSATRSGSPTCWPR
ncbi:MAG: hypothetical protein R3C16_04095 [Hyphomonadaceae bacterium]